MDIKEICEDIADMVIERDAAAKAQNFEYYNLCDASIDFLNGEIEKRNAAMTASKLTAVRDCLRERLGDHMVASTVFAKAFPFIWREIAGGAKPIDVARACDYVDFAGSDDYEGSTAVQDNSEARHLFDPHYNR